MTAAILFRGQSYGRHQCVNNSADILIESKNGALILAFTASKSVSLMQTASNNEVVPNVTPTQLLAKAVLYKLASIFVVILGHNKVLPVPTTQLPLPIVSTSVSKNSQSVARASASASQSVPKVVPVASQSVPIAYTSMTISRRLASPSHSATQIVSVASQSVPVASNLMPLSVPVASPCSVPQPAPAVKISHLAVKQAKSMTMTQRKYRKLGSSTDFKCDECGLSYMNSKTFNWHKKEKHSCTTSSGSQSCLENECSFSSFHVHQLRDHLEKSHSIDMKICTKKFESNHGLFHFVHCVLFVIDFRF